ncbi:MAG: hypothetical protein ACJ75B_06745 [Flavisolibacter sp.]
MQSYMGEEGSFLYSSINTLKKGDYYLLGINPGGSGGQTLKSSLDNLPKKLSNDYDDDWSETKKYTPGGAPLQNRLRSLFADVNVSLENVCATNLVFIKSKNQKGIAIWELAEKCWPVHRLFLNIVEPKYIITFGKITFQFISKKNQLQQLTTIPSGHGNWKVQIAYKPDFPTLIGFPHFSRYKALKNILQIVQRCVLEELHLTSEFKNH